MADEASEKNRITMLRELLQMSQTEFSRKIGISQGALSQIESGRSRLSMESLKNLSKAFNVNCNWLVNGEGDIFFQNPEKKNNRRSKGIPLIDLKARAGYIKQYKSIDYLNTLDTYYIPGFEDAVKFRMFEIAGESMYPTLLPTEIVIAHKTNKSFKKETLAVLLTNENIIAKRVKINPDNREQIKLISDNPDFHNMEVRSEDIMEAWEIKGKITKKLLRNYPVDSNSLIGMEKDLKSLKVQLSEFIKGKK